ncbi:palmitoyl-protein thioesterase [Acrasis kona]|uniref:Palmitoyl-protein thioesterase 1 n=1 Tax=Acrasis kona TaxID=1008807 RepID=A0AAW2YKC6_9EUKA
MAAIRSCVTLLIVVLCLCNAAQLPVVLWHGMGDSCCFPFSMGKIQKRIEDYYNGTISVHSVRIGNGNIEDVANSYMKNANDQIDIACEQLVNTEAIIKSGGAFNAIGFSQGSQFLRAVVQRCSNNDTRPNAAGIKLQVNNLISIGGQHRGVFGLPRCIGANVTLCEYARRMLDYGAYLGFVQDHLAQSNYWNDPLDQETYLKKCTFLPDINNEKSIKKPSYKENLTKLNKLVLVQFMQDTMVQPRESQWFGTYKLGQDKEVVNMVDTDLYKEDWIGLKKLNEDHRIDFLECPGDHLRFTEEWFKTNIMHYLK